MKRNTRSLIAGFLILTLATLACGISIPGGAAIDNAATSVAGTINALAETAGVALTAIPHDLPTFDLPTLPPVPVEYPIRAAFVSPDGNLYTWAEGMAAPLQLTFTGDVNSSSVSPDGTLIAYTRYASYVLVSLDIINSDGTNQRTLLNAAGFAALPHPAESVGVEPYQIKWAPNSHILAMNTRITYEGPGLQIGDNLFLINGDTGAMSTLISVGPSWRFFYSPDGTKIAITYPTGIDIYNSDGAKIAGPVLVHDFINTASEYAWVTSPVWSADGATLAGGIPPKEPWVDAPANSYVYQVAADGLSGGLVFGAPMPGMTGGSVAVSPDLNKILYYTRLGLPADNTYTLHVANIDGSANVDYATGRFRGDPVWSPDNSHFFYTLGDGLSSNSFIGQVGVGPAAVMDYNNAIDAQWVDANRYLVTTNNAGRWRLLLGTIGAPTGLIYDSISPYTSRLTFSVNR
ncbi:MAG: Uncharacterized protein FD147_1834 [Chloroflexi bacterium]|nr:MAG: Uncharacterized protein FD147_1834 [Chloroflexota bacterium]